MENLQLPILWATLSAFVGSFMLYLFSIWGKGNDKASKLARMVMYLGFGLNTVSLLLRTILIKGLPLNNTMEFGMCFVWLMMLAFIIIDRKTDLKGVALLVLLIAVGLVGWLITCDMHIRPLMPALRSNWLAFHVTTAVIAYGAFAVAFALSIVYLIKEYAEKNGKQNLGAKLPELELLDNLSYKLIFMGLPCLTIMLVTGSVWAEYTWGRFWSWDPKETWALITWLIYALYLHVRFMKGWKGKKAAVLSVLGFAAVIFTFLGVTYLLPGIHSYV